MLSNEDVIEARLSEGLMACKLKVTLAYGRTMRWKWLPRYGSYDDVASASAVAG